MINTKEAYEMKIRSLVRDMDRLISIIEKIVTSPEEAVEEARNILPILYEFRIKNKHIITKYICIKGDTCPINQEAIKLSKSCEGPVRCGSTFPHYHSPDGHSDTNCTPECIEVEK